MNRIRNVLANWGGFVVTAAINFVLAPIVVHGLGDVSYGIWILLGSIVGYLGLLDLGVRGAVTRYVAKFHALGNHADATRVASSAFVIFSSMGLVAIAGAGFLTFFIDQVFQIPDGLVSVARIVLFVGGLNIAVSMVSGVFGGIVVGLQRFDLANGLEIVISILNAAAIITALKAGLGLIALASIQLGMSLLRGISSYWISRRLYPQLVVAFKECSRAHISTIFSFSISILLLQASGMLILFADSIVIGTYLPLSMVTFFAIAANLTEYARAPISGITHTLTPWASTLEATNDLDGVQRVLISVARIATLVVLPIVITFILRGHSFIGLWMGPEYAVLSGNVLSILSVSLWFAVGYQVVNSTMMGISKHGGLVPAFVIEALCNVSLSLILVRSHGIIGVAWGTLVPRLVAACFFGPWYARRVLNVPILEFWLNVWIKPSIAMIPFGVASWYLEMRWEADGLILYFTQIAAVLPLAALGAWVVCLTPEEKERLVHHGIVKRFVSKFET